LSVVSGERTACTAHGRFVHALQSLSDISRERSFIEVFAVLSEKRRQDENENDDERSMVPRASGLFPLALTPTLTLLTAASK
jgi:hypothetical protein